MAENSAKALTFPGFIDLHVHLREPGMEEAETVASALAAARSGGVACVVAMPNTTPPLDCAGAIRNQYALARAAGGSVVFLSSGCISKGRAGGEVAPMEEMAEAGAVFFTDDGAYAADAKTMEEAMRRAAALGLAVCEHALDPRIVRGGVMRDCALARRLGLATIPADAETEAIRRDISICRTTGCKLHIQHISTAEGVELVRSARKEGLPVSAEATPHHLALSCDGLEADDANFKMAPPLGNDEDRAELRKGVKDGVLMFATDHAPHPAATKCKGFALSANGIVGLETAAGVTWRAMVEEEGMEPEAWARAWTDMPLAVLPPSVRATLGQRPRTEVVLEKWRVEPEAFASKSRNTPFGGMELTARARLAQARVSGGLV